MPELPNRRGHNGGPPIDDQAPRPPAVPSPVTTIKNGALYVGVGLTKFYELIGAGEVPVIRIGERTLVRLAALDALLDRNERRGPVRGPQGNPRRDQVHRAQVQKPKARPATGRPAAKAAAKPKTRREAPAGAA